VQTSRDALIAPVAYYWSDPSQWRHININVFAPYFWTYLPATEYSVSL
jgi:hypothetical protein